MLICGIHHSKHYKSLPQCSFPQDSLWREALSAATWFWWHTTHDGGQEVKSGYDRMRWRWSPYCASLDAITRGRFFKGQYIRWTFKSTYSTSFKALWPNRMYAVHAGDVKRFQLPQSKEINQLQSDRVKEHLKLMWHTSVIPPSSCQQSVPQSASCMFVPFVNNNTRHSAETLVGFSVPSIKNSPKHHHNDTLFDCVFG